MVDGLPESGGGEHLLLCSARVGCGERVPLLWVDDAARDTTHTVERRILLYTDMQELDPCSPFLDACGVRVEGDGGGGVAEFRAL